MLIPVFILHSLAVLKYTLASKLIPFKKKKNPAVWGQGQSS